MKTINLQNATDSPKTRVVGEVDTRAPFQSVKDAVNLFGEGVFSGEKPTIKKFKPHSAERIHAKEDTQLHLAQKELSKLKEQIDNAERTKSQALTELDEAKKIGDELSYKLKAVTESKESVTKETEVFKTRIAQLEKTSSGNAVETGDAWKQDLEATRQQYLCVIADLDSAKQHLRKIQHDCDAFKQEQVAALMQVTEADRVAKANMERHSELSKEISVVQESIRQVKLATLQVQHEQANIYAGKDVQRKLHRATLEDLMKKLLALNNEFDPEHAKNLKAQLVEAEIEIRALQKNMENARASDLDSLRSVISELDNSKESLQKMVNEEVFFRNMVESLELELENVKTEHSKLKEKEAETESIAGSLHFKLHKCRSELEACRAEELKVRGTSDELMLTLDQLLTETENARQDVEELKRKDSELKREAEITRIALDEEEKKLIVALKEADEANASETRALNEIRIVSERTSATRASTSESGNKITISKEEYESLSRKVEESDTLTEMKVAASKALIEAVKASESEAQKRLEATQKEISGVKSAREAALKSAEMAEGAKRMVEGELRRWREREEKKANEIASRITAETVMSPIKSPQRNTFQKQNLPEKVSQKLDKEKISISKKVLLPNLSSLFHRKKNQLEGVSPYLIGEKFV